MKYGRWVNQNYITVAPKKVKLFKVFPLVLFWVSINSLKFLLSCHVFRFVQTKKILDVYALHACEMIQKIRGWIRSFNLFCRWGCENKSPKVLADRHKWRFESTTNWGTFFMFPYIERKWNPSTDLSLACMQITDAVVAAYMLNSTLVIPELDNRSYWKDQRSA